MSAHTTADTAAEPASAAVDMHEDEDVTLVAPERQVPDLELSEWQSGYWPSSRNITQ